jgi:O-antigen/teichoic acid export membrane protein
MSDVIGLIKNKLRIVYKPMENINLRALIFLICQLISQGLGFILAPILTRLLIPADYGRATTYVTYLAVLSIFISIQSASTINNAKMDYTEEQFKEYLSSVIGMVLLIYLGFQSLFAIFVQPLSSILGYDPWLIILMPVVALGNYGISFVTMLYIREKRAFMFMIISLTNAIFSALLSLLFIVITSGDKAVAKIVGYSIPSIVVGLLVLVVYALRGRKLYQKAYYNYAFKLSIPFFMGSLSSFLNLQSDRLMLVKLSGLNAVGIYSFAVTMALPMMTLVNALNNSWLPRFFDLYKDQKYELLNKSSKNYQLTYTFLTLGFLLISPEIITLIASSKYYGAISMVPWLVVAYYFSFMGRFPVNFMVFHKKVKSVSLSTFLSAVFTILLNWFMIPMYGALGAAITCAVTNLFIWLLFEYFARHSGIDYQLYNYWYFLVGFVVVVIAAILSQWLLGVWLVRWSMALIVGLGLLRHIKKAKGLF